MFPGHAGSRSLSSKSPLPTQPLHHPLINKFKTGVKGGLRFAGVAAVTGGAIHFAAGGIFPNSATSGKLARRGPGGGPPSATRGGGGGLSSLTTTQGLLALNALAYGAQVLSKEALTLWGAKVNELIIAGQWWRLATPAFLHGNLMHLLVNCYSLYNLAPLVENTSGGRRLIAVYLTAAVAGNVASFYGSKVPSLGASGAVFGIGGAVAVYFYRNKEFYGKKADYVLKQLGQTLLINLVYGLSNPRIDNWGHMGGLVGGALAAYLLGPRLKLGTIDGQKGQMYLLDVPPVPLLAAPPRQVKR